MRPPCGQACLAVLLAWLPGALQIGCALAPARSSSTLPWGRGPCILPQELSIHSRQGRGVSMHSAPAGYFHIQQTSDRECESSDTEDIVRGEGGDAFAHQRAAGPQLRRRALRSEARKGQRNGEGRFFLHHCWRVVNCRGQDGQSLWHPVQTVRELEGWL